MRGEVRLTIPGAVIEPAYSQLLMVRTALLLEDVLALDRVQKKLPISTEAMTQLRKAKLVEGRKPHVRVSSEIASASGRLVDYVRARPQADAHHATLVRDICSAAGCNRSGDRPAVAAAAARGSFRQKGGGEGLQSAQQDA